MDLKEGEILLSICIPTYNRSKFLDLCLSQLLKQIDPFKNIVEVIISNNCSPDDTDDIVEKYKNLGFEIHYNKNKENIGADGNLEKCFQLSTGKYLWLFGDDDLILDGKFDKIIHILQNTNYGSIHLKHYWFMYDYIKEMPSTVTSEFKYLEYTDSIEYLKVLNVQTTFISGNIINKSLISGNIDSKKYLSSNLNHLYWILNAIFQSKKNLIVESPLLACQAGNTGGYELFKTFAVSFRNICIDAGVKNNVPDKFMHSIDNQLLFNFFPSFILDYKRKIGNTFNTEKPNSILYNEFKNKPIYWGLVFPLFFLPNKVDKFYLRAVRKLIKPFI
jgi:abequosyltransferase